MPTSRCSPPCSSPRARRKSTLLRSILTTGGATFGFGPAEASDAVSAAGQTITPPPGRGPALKLLATAVNGSQMNQTFTVTYWQQKSLRVSGKGVPYGKQSKKRVVPMSRQAQALLEPYFALNEKWFVGPRQAQKIVKRVAERARISQDEVWALGIEIGGTKLQLGTARATGG